MNPLLLPTAAALCMALAGCATPERGADAPAANPSAATPAPTARPVQARLPGLPLATPSATAAAAGAAAALPGAAPGTPQRPPAPPGPPPFAQLIADATRIDGPLVLWRKDDKVWIELLPAQFGQPFLLSPKIREGISQAWVLGGLMSMPINGVGGAQVVEFQRVHNQVRLAARNTDISAQPGTPEARAVAASYATSLLGAVPVASQPHPDRKSVLIEANGLFLSDLIGVGMMLQQGLRQGYALDRNNSVITGARGTPEATILETQAHFFTGAPAMVPPNAPPGAPVPLQLRHVPDPRSVLVGLHYSIAPLPAQPMPARPADPRLGFFTSTVLDFSSDLPSSPRQRIVNRWRLDKQDPAAERSPPVKPITFWIDNNVPLAYRDTVREGILEWNKAFERIGFQDAIVVQQQPDDADWDTLDFGRASVRWMMNADPAFGAIGPSHVDPRTGEILDADIGFEGMAARMVRGVRNEVLESQLAGAAPSVAAGPARVFESMLGRGFASPPSHPLTGAAHVHSAHCLHGLLAAEQASYALDVLQARGDMDPDSPEARQFVLDFVKESIMHEVGHALGLRHNFRASRIYSEAQLSDPAFTRVHGTTGSVMEYNAVNLPRPGERGGVPFQTSLGPYDYWAIEYAYRPLPPDASVADQRAVLQAIAARSSEPALAYGTDEDVALGLDPETLQLDLGDDPIAFASKRMAIARDLFRRQEMRELPPDRDYAVLRRSLDFALADTARATGVLARQIGGVRTLRDFPGSGRDPLEPVPAELQRQALTLITDTVLAASGLSISPALQRRLAPDFLDRADAPMMGTDFALQARLLSLQRSVLNYLLSDAIAHRLLDNVGKLDDPRQAFALAELYQHTTRAVWGEPARAGAISGPRRELQREHVNRVATALVRPSPTARADQRSLLREHARGLVRELEAAHQQAVRAGTRADAATRAHLADSAETLRLVLAAPLQRLGL